MNSEKIHKMVGTGVLTAVVIVVYLLTMGISVGPFNITFALIPIVVGAALYGWVTGGWLGLVFGAMVLFTGGANAFLVINVPGTIITVLVKGAAAGLVPGLIYSALEKKNRWAATICAAAAPSRCPRGEPRYGVNAVPRTRCRTLGTVLISV